MTYAHALASTGMLEIEDVPPRLGPPLPTAQLGFSRDMKFFMDAQVEVTTRIIRAIFEFPSFIRAMAEKLLFHDQRANIPTKKWKFKNRSDDRGSNPHRTICRGIISRNSFSAIRAQVLLIQCAREKHIVPGFSL